MKKLIILLNMVMLSIGTQLQAADNSQQRMNKEEFRAKQQAFITEKAKLTREEANKFFPIYFELQDKKKILNDEAWQLMRKGREEKTTEAQYEEILEGVYKSRLSSAQLEQTYLEKFKKILSCKKIFLVQRAEMRFHRELLRDMKPKKK